MSVVSQVLVRYINKHGISHNVVVKDNKMIKYIQYIYGGTGVLECCLLSSARTKKEALSDGKKYLQQKRSDRIGGKGFST